MKLGSTSRQGIGRGFQKEAKDAMRTIISIVAVLMLTLALATSAAAQQAGDDGYKDSGGQVQSQVDQGGNGEGGSPVSADTGGSLPFTGLDVALLVAAGGLLAGAGFGMRRLTRPVSSA
jgi:hypothetical protein